MQFSKCRKCNVNTRLSDLNHCCSLSFLVCKLCQKRSFCFTCKKSYLEKGRCPDSCKCLLAIHRKPVRGLTPIKVTKICPSCKKPQIHCLCVPQIVTQLKPKMIDEPRCGKCCQTTPVADLFYNVSCGHELCPKCFSPQLNQCFCGSKIESNSYKLFNQLCIVCDQQFKNEKNFSDTDEYFICQKCKQKSESMEKSFKQEKSFEMMDVSMQSADEKIKQSSTQFTIQQNNSQQKDITLLDKSSQQIKKQKFKKQIVDRLFADSNNKQNKHQKKEDQILQRKGEYKVRSKMNKYKSCQADSAKKSLDLSKNSICVICNIQFNYHLFDHSSCSNKAHKVCKLCLIKNYAKDKICLQCEREEEIRLDKIFNYQELKEAHQPEYVEKEINGFGMCTKCCIVVEKRKIDEGLCRMCIIV